MTQTIQAPRRTLPALTGSRFVAAFGVVVFHYGLGALGPLAAALEPICAAAASGVSFFYVLSGAVLTLGCTADDGRPSKPTRTFWTQRAARVLPAYLLALGLSLLPGAINILGHHPGPGGVAVLLLAFMAALLVLQAFLPPLAGGLNTPSWSVSCEALFYFVWPKLVAPLRPASSSGAAGLLGLLYLAVLAPPLAGLWLLHAGLVSSGPFLALPADASGVELLSRTLTYFPLLRLPEFSMGVVLGHALRGAPERMRDARLDTLREVLLAVALGAALSTLGNGVSSRLSGVPGADRLVIESGALAPLFAALVWQLARGRGLLQRCFSLAPLLLLGEASYAVYILQEPVLVWSTAALKRTNLSGWIAQPSFFWCYAALLVLVSVAVFRWVETPLRPRISRWLSNR